MAFVIIVNDSQLGWVLVKVMPEYHEMQIWHQFGEIENAFSWIDGLVEWRNQIKTLGIPSSFLKAFENDK